jgi:hypothetical protein
MLSMKDFSPVLTFVEEVRDNKNVASTSLITLQLIMKTLKLTVVGFVPLHHCPLQLWKNQQLTLHFAVSLTRLRITVFLTWVLCILCPHAATHSNKIYLYAHLCNKSITALNHCGIKENYITAGNTAVLQPTEKGMHNPFKQYIREENNAWMVAHQQRGINQQGWKLQQK